MRPNYRLLLAAGCIVSASLVVCITLALLGHPSAGYLVVIYGNAVALVLILRWTLATVRYTRGL